MADFEKVFQDVIAREGGSKVTNHPFDQGGRTQYGISETSNPAAWADGKVTEAEAREIFLAKYVVWPKFHLIPASHLKLQEQLIDFGFNSGPQLAVVKLQALLNLKQDGIIGPATLDAVAKSDPTKINNQLVRARVQMIGRVVQKDLNQVKFLTGLLDRALSFIV